MDTKFKKIESINHSIYFNEEGYDALLKLCAKNNYSKIVIITDDNCSEYCLEFLLEELTTETTIEIIEFDPGEENKTLETCNQVWGALIDVGADRKSLIINLGGGVVTDLGGFVASTYKRGIDFVHIPTSLLAMVDAAIGGKNGVDLNGLKNQIGTITNPKMVIIDISYLSTLPQSQMQSGMAEIYKHGLIANKSYWEDLTDFDKLATMDIEKFIHESITIKNNIIKEDPTETGIRKALNFGHTLGHAIESYCLETPTQKTLLHGQAIAMGMILESYLSWKIGKLSPAEYLEIKTKINHVFDKINFNQNDIELILKYLIHDKKNEYGTIQFALLNGIGKTAINQTVSNDLIQKAFQDYNT
jgi:3-dehydroquinate synthase